MAVLKRGDARERLTANDSQEQRNVERLFTSGALVIDERRRRPRYFDGRFLAARDLTREQEYFLARQDDLGRARGAGVVRGLAVTPGDEGADSLTISAGHGITLTGELVVVDEPITVNMTDIPEIELLNTSLGLSRIPSSAGRNRSGIFILALRPLEFTANPIASYPTTITGTRSVEDGDIIEAVAITLIPYPDGGSQDRSDNLDRRRSRIAREIFTVGLPPGIATGTLPLAMIALERNVVRWIDPFLVRREVGADHGDVLGLGFAPRALREAYAIQYDQQLKEVMLQRQNANQSPRFAATDHFLALPPAGRMPKASVDPVNFLQVFFPPDVDVDLSFIPDDELMLVLEESLLLPPIDLTLTGDELESTSVLVLVPYPRRQIRQLQNALNTLTRPLRSAAAGLIARRRPLEILTGLRVARGDLILPVQPLVETDPWRQALEAAPELWFVRRRNLAYKTEVIGIAEPFTPASPTQGTTRLPAPSHVAELMELLAKFEMDDEYKVAVGCVGRGNKDELDRQLMSAFRRDRSGALAVALLTQILEECDRSKAFPLDDVGDPFKGRTVGKGLSALNLDERTALIVSRSSHIVAFDAAVSQMKASERAELAAKLMQASEDEVLKIVEDVARPR